MNLTGIRAGIGGLLAMLVLAGAATLALPANSQTLQSSSLTEEDWISKAPEPARQTPKVRFPIQFRASELFLAGGTAFDMATTVSSLDHPTTALRSDGSFLTHYYVREQGWAGIFGRRDPWTAVAANTLLNYGVDRFSKKLYARGGKWRALSYGTVILKGTLNSLAATSNLRNEARIDTQVRLMTGYQGRIVWSR